MLYQQPNSGFVLLLYATFESVCKLITNVSKWGREKPEWMAQRSTGGGARYEGFASRESHDIVRVYIRPSPRDLNGKDERSHRVDEQEFDQLHL
jgi:hypothetical protein